MLAQWWASRGQSAAPVAGAVPRGPVHACRRHPGSQQASPAAARDLRLHALAWPDPMRLLHLSGAPGEPLTHTLASAHESLAPQQGLQLQAKPQRPNRVDEPQRSAGAERSPVVQGESLRADQQCPTQPQQHGVTHLAAEESTTGALLHQRLRHALACIEASASAGHIHTSLAALLFGGIPLEPQQLRQALAGARLSDHAIALAACARAGITLPDAALTVWGDELVPLLVPAVAAAAHAAASASSVGAHSMPSTHTGPRQPKRVKRDKSLVQQQPQQQQPTTTASPAPVDVDVPSLASGLSVLASLGSMNRRCSLPALAGLLRLTQLHLPLLAPSQLIALGVSLSRMDVTPYTVPFDELLVNGVTPGSPPPAPPPNTWMQDWLLCVLRHIHELSGPQVCVVLRVVAMVDTHAWASQRPHAILVQDLVRVASTTPRWAPDLLDLLPQPRADAMQHMQHAQNGNEGSPAQPHLREHPCCSTQGSVDAVPRPSGLAALRSLRAEEVRVAVWSLRRLPLPMPRSWLLLLVSSVAARAPRLAPATLADTFHLMAELRPGPLRRGDCARLWVAVAAQWRHFSPNRRTALLCHAWLAGLPPPRRLLHGALEWGAAMAEVQLCDDKLDAAAGAARHREPLTPLHAARLLFVAAAAGGLRLERHRAMPLAGWLAEGRHQLRLQVTPQALCGLAAIAPAGLLRPGAHAGPTSAVSAAAVGASLHALVAVWQGKASRAPCAQGCARTAWAATRLGLVLPPAALWSLIRGASPTARSGALPAPEAAMLLCCIASAGLAVVVPGGTTGQRGQTHAEAARALRVDVRALLAAVLSQPPAALATSSPDLLPAFLARLSKSLKACNEQEDPGDEGAETAPLRIADWLCNAHRHVVQQGPDASCSSAALLDLVLAAADASTIADHIQHSDATGAERLMDVASSTASAALRLLEERLDGAREELQGDPQRAVDIVWALSRLPRALLQPSHHLILSCAVDAADSGLLSLRPPHVPRLLLGVLARDAAVAATPALAQPGHVQRPSHLLAALGALPVDGLKAACARSFVWGSAAHLAAHEAAAQAQAGGSATPETHSAPATDAHVSRLVCEMTADQLCATLLGMAGWGVPPAPGALHALLAVVDARGWGSLSVDGCRHCVQGLLMMRAWPGKPFFNFLNHQLKRLRLAGRFLDPQEDLHMRQAMHALGALGGLSMQHEAGLQHVMVPQRSAPALVLAQPAWQAAGVRLLRRLFLYQLQAALLLLARMLAGSHPPPIQAALPALRQPALLLTAGLNAAGSARRFPPSPSAERVANVADAALGLLVAEQGLQAQPCALDSLTRPTSMHQASQAQLAALLHVQFNRVMVCLATSRGLQTP